MKRDGRKTMMRAGAFLLAFLMLLGVFVEPAMAMQDWVGSGLTPMEMDALATDPAQAYDLDEAAPPAKEAIPIVPITAPVEVIEIGTPAQLRAFLSGGLGPNDAHYVLTANINVTTGLAAFVTQGRGLSSYDGTTMFTGTFDGRGHTITNLRLRRVAGDDIAGNALFNTSVGFIRNVGDGARIENVRFSNDLTNQIFLGNTAGAAGANLRVGTVVGRAVSGAVTIENVHLTGARSFMEISAHGPTTRVGGLVGHVEARAGVTIRDISLNDFEVNSAGGATHSVGGVIGSSNGTVTVTAANPGGGTTTIAPPVGGVAPSGRNHIRVNFRGGGRYDITNNANRAGGVIGYAAAGSRTTIEHTIVTGSPRLPATDNSFFIRGTLAGGFVGTTGSSGSLTIRDVTNHVNIGGVRANTRAGGIVGRIGMPTTLDNVRNFCSNDTSSTESGGQTDATINATVATGLNLGGIVGRTDGVTTITNAHNSGTVISGVSPTGGTGSNTRNHTSFLGGIVGFVENRITIHGATNTAEIRRSRSSARANNHVGGIIGHINNGGSAANRRAELRNVTNTGNINAQTGTTVTLNAGGIVGFIRDRASAVVVIENATNRGNVRARNNAGGIIGHANSRNILIVGAMNYGNISTSQTGARRAGGIVGLGSRAQLRIFDSGNAGTITSASTGSAGTAGFGGLVG
ncbi:MAG: hypothetical protein FWD84_04245, partial [Oscillospiraceae bacterium]|nr:hypothetical protein [Oscillospiraceae bacterium]